MRGRGRSAARIAGVAGLGAVAALHALWASGSSWPAADGERLAEAVVGRSDALPGPGPTAVVAAGAAGAALLASGALGDGRPQRLGLRAVGGILLLRAALGGDAALVALGMPPAGDTFRRLDRRWYRPFAALLGLALWRAAGR